MLGVERPSKDVWERYNYCDLQGRRESYRAMSVASGNVRSVIKQVRTGNVGSVFQVSTKWEKRPGGSALLHS